MEIFGVLKKILTQIGMNGAKRKPQIFYQTIAWAVTGLVLFYAVSTKIWYLIFEANDFGQYAEVLLWIILYTCTSSKYCIFSLENVAINDFIQTIEHIIDYREYTGPE